MLRIISMNGTPYTWKVGDDKIVHERVKDIWRPLHTELHMQVQVKELRADGDEYAYIATNFKNIPIRYGYGMIWKGEIAQLIYDNLLEWQQ